MYAQLPVFNNLFSAHVLLPVFIGIVAIVVKKIMRFFLNVQVGHFQQTVPRR